MTLGITMYLKYLKAKDFRNYSAIDIQCSERINIFFGRNAQGKTNLLEAITLLGHGRSFRTKKDQELIRWGTEACFLRGDFDSAASESRVEIGIGVDAKKSKIDGRPVKNNELLGQIPLVIFSPDDLQIVKGGPQHRRDFIDFYLVQIDPKYRYVYYNYHQVLQQRNRLLKENRPDRDQLEVWNEQLVEKGSKVIRYRIQFLNAAQPYINRAQFRISGNAEELSLSYLGFHNQALADADEEQLQTVFRRELERLRTAEVCRQVTLVGPHRDDLRIALATGMELRAFGSQGQQRTAVLALKIGLLEKILETRGVYPILLLDDVMSEFDDLRKQKLLELLLEGSQTFLTSTGRRDFPIESSLTQFFEVEQGIVANVL